MAVEILDHVAEGHLIAVLAALEDGEAGAGAAVLRAIEDRLAGLETERGA